ncbi:butyrophilin subfamily 1 member A1-like isoform X1 [Anabas testudineus]|uniref:butyrophilin subfamily 1 member A1-like isoform X1 n=1 Tax=Anabas testudineus TaxID=64144 RepID=UPI000E45BB05|nr:butyrophilin subfamily 1 member A1-like isoform X1 [Anabas testudineus]XP_026208294.1 butyrophilin subfamily 1 member A1-like isoform X2 [Anabas testudineus]XP_026208295.1 butyrophilin subfamily 1 member A1-like isoform X1 [Anabas testudineus]
MGVQVIYMCFMALLCSHLNSAAPVSDNLIVSVQSSVSVQHGHTTTLPCWLNPSQNAEGMEVRWYYADRFDTPFMLYRAQTVDSSQDTSYKGRVSFGLKDGLKTGNVSLKLVNATIGDAGDYTCYITSDQGYDKGTITLSVIEMGTSPFLSVEWKEDNLVNVSCESVGWYPQPHLRWADQEQNLNPKSLLYSKSSSGLVSVHSWVQVPSTSDVSCTVGLPDGEEKVARVHLGNPPQHATQGSGSSVGGWVAFGILLIGSLVVFGLLYFKKRALFSWKKDESESCVKATTALAEALNYYVNVTLDKVDHPYLIIKDCIVRDQNLQFPDGADVTCLTAIKGSPGFSSGKHYWEVSIYRKNVGFKRSWWVGVTTATAFPLQSDVPPTTSNGFWFLSSSPDREDSFQFSTQPNVLLPVRSMPQTVGVYLNYDSGELSFYNVEDRSVIGSLTAKFTGEVFPLFNPGKNDAAPMKIIHKPMQDENSDIKNSVQSTAPEPNS